MSNVETQQQAVRVSAGSRHYFLDLKQSQHGLYLTITESKHANGAFERQRILVEGEHVQGFMEALEKLVEDASLKSYRRWTKKEDELLEAAVHAHRGIAEIARVHEREPNAIRSRIRQLGLARAPSDD